ncbi:MAG: hypothetical protein OXH99_24795 [Bryobacterales bacterium]|nr:hypothetical protein [Bryobacterales bacterium]
MRLIFHSMRGLAVLAVLGMAPEETVQGQTPLTPTESTARELGIDLEIVGAGHPALPDLEKGYKQHGGFGVQFKGGGIAYARVDSGGVLLQPILVFHRTWKDEQPMEARAVGCPANPYLSLDDPVACFRAILQKMEGGRGPVLLQVRYFSMGKRVATLPINTVAIPWTYIRHYAKMKAAERPGGR